jgi:hypothetical protein
MVGTSRVKKPFGFFDVKDLYWKFVGLNPIDFFLLRWLFDLLIFIGFFKESFALNFI